jgi:multidrug efflux pump subunit AcrA (membrane-fusion protein)
VKGSRPDLLGGGTEVTTETVRLSSAKARKAGTLTEGGWVEVPSYHPIAVSALVPGRVEELLVLEGSRVEKGQVVASLYDKDLRDALRLAEAEVSEARAALDLHSAGYRKEDVEKARSEVARLDEEKALAEKVLARTRKLVPEGAASEERLERDEAAVGTAADRLDSARQELSKLEAGFRVEEVAKARAAFARAEAARDLAKSRLGYADVRSPVAGVVLERHVTPGTWLTAGDPRVVSLYDPGDLQVRVDVRQESAGRIRVGQSVEVSTDAEPGKAYRGVLIRIEPMADLKKNTVQAKVRLEDPGPGLHPEMICRVRFLEDGEPDEAPQEMKITVPTSSVVGEGGSRQVFLVKDGRAVRCDVRLGEEKAGRVEVLAGLSEGDRVVVAPPPGLRDGGEVVEVGR